MIVEALSLNGKLRNVSDLTTFMTLLAKALAPTDSRSAAVLLGASRFMERRHGIGYDYRFADRDYVDLLVGFAPSAPWRQGTKRSDRVDQRHNVRRRHRSRTHPGKPVESRPGLQLNRCSGAVREAAAARVGEVVGRRGDAIPVARPTGGVDDDRRPVAFAGSVTSWSSCFLGQSGGTDLPPDRRLRAERPPQRTTNALQVVIDVPAAEKLSAAAHGRDQFHGDQGVPAPRLPGRVGSQATRLNPPDKSFRASQNDLSVPSPMCRYLQWSVGTGSLPGGLLRGHVADGGGRGAWVRSWSVGALLAEGAAVLDGPPVADQPSGWGRSDG